MRRAGSTTLRLASATAVAGAAWLVALGPSAAQSAGTTTFSATGSAQRYVVPAGVCSLEIRAAGANGGTTDAEESPGGVGGTASGTLSVTEGAVFEIFVGGAGGAPDPFFAGGAGGFNGGGDGGEGTAGTNEVISTGGGGGGGGSSVFLGDVEILTAGGGGGSGGFSEPDGTLFGGAGGNGGGGNGDGAAGVAPNAPDLPEAGGGATVAVPGVAGLPGGLAGLAGEGGTGGNGDSDNGGAGGGGGGGGHFGGGGAGGGDTSGFSGSAGAGAGGGSGYADASVTLGGTLETQDADGNGRVTIVESPCPTTTTAATTTAATTTAATTTAAATTVPVVGTLPPTGSGSRDMAVLSFALVALGLGLVLVAARRTSRQSDS